MPQAPVFERSTRLAALCLAVLAGLAAIAGGGGDRADAQATDPAQIDIGNGCASIECHGNMLNRRTVHTAVKDEMCEACHEPTGAGHVFEPVRDAPDVCLECHDAFPEDQVMHDIVAAGECLSCHDPHGSAVPQLLQTATLVETCTNCHDDPSEGMAAPHAPAQRGECLGCHEAHVSKHKALLNDTPPNLCLRCHDKARRRRDGPLIQNIGEVLSTTAHLHPPFADGECLECHGPHGGKARPSLIAAYPISLYAPFQEDTYELCFQCHDTELVTAPETEDTGFRDGTRNLHFLHVQKSKGRTCRVCHDPHGTDLPHLIQAGVAFGEWQLRLRHEELPTGGRCFPGCHREVTYTNAPAP